MKKHLLFLYLIFNVVVVAQGNTLGDDCNLSYISMREGLPSNSCRNLCEDRFGRLWIAFNEGVNVLELNTMQEVSPLSPHSSFFPPHSSFRHPVVTPERDN